MDGKRPSCKGHLRLIRNVTTIPLTYGKYCGLLGVYHSWDRIQLTSSSQFPWGSPTPLLCQWQESIGQRVVSISDDHTLYKCNFGQMICLLILFLQDLHKFGREPLAHLSFDHAQIFSHPFSFGLKVTVNVSDNNLQIVVYDYWHGPCCFSQVEARDDCFIFCLIVGRWELEADYTFYCISF